MSHRDNFAFECTIHHVPTTLINHKGSHAMITRILICLRYNPSRGVGNSLFTFLIIFRVSGNNKKKPSLQDTRLFVEGPKHEVSASPLQYWCPSSRNGDIKYRYKKFVDSSETDLRRCAKF